jgi:hypothetical protein
MAKSPKSAKAADPARVSAYLGRLLASKTDRNSFEAVVGDLDADANLSAADWIAIAHQYNNGGKKPASKAAALAMIKKRFVEIVRTANKNKVAEKARPW